MRALCWNGVNDLAVETVDDPRITNPHDVIVQVRLTTTCGSDLHFINGYLPGMKEGDVFGHEFMGEVIETGSEVTQTSVGARVVVPSFIGCKSCWYCDRDLYSVCIPPIPMPSYSNRSSAIPLAESTATHTHSADTKGPMPNTSAYRSVMSIVLQFRRASPTSRRCSFRTQFPQD